MKVNKDNKFKLFKAMLKEREHEQKLDDSRSYLRRKIGLNRKVRWYTKVVHDD